MLLFHIVASPLVIFPTLSSHFYSVCYLVSSQAVVPQKETCENMQVTHVGRRTYVRTYCVYAAG